MHRSIAFALVLFCLAPVSLRAQTYIYTESTGNVDFMFDLRYYLEMKFDGPADQVLSEWQTLPFDWYFYGQKVEGYYISDNGYITFDKSASTSVSENIALPDPTAPNDAIFAFWDALHLDDNPSEWSNCVRTATIGIAPNRKHVIYWIGVAPERYAGSSSNTLSFAVVLNEGGDFDVIFVAGAHRPDMSATLGVQHAAGGVFATMVDGPDMDFPLVTADPNDDITYSFEYSDSQLDGAAAESLMPLTAVQGASVPVKFLFQNTGSHTIIGFDAHYVGTSEVLYTKQIRNVSLPTNGRYTVVFDDTWTAQDAGSFTDLTVWIDNVDDGLDGTFDDNQKNDTLHIPVWVQLGEFAPRRVMMEEFTGAWCQWCPDGALKVEQAVQKYGDDIIAVALHAGGTDFMIIPEGQEIADLLANGYPSGLVDRVKFTGEDRHALTRSKWDPAIAQRINVGSPLTLSVNSTFESTSRRVQIRAYMDWVDYPYPAQYQLNVWLKEDRLQGDGIGWDQRNAFSGNPSYPNHPYYGLPDPIEEYVHMQVFRASMTGTWGEPIGPKHVPGPVQYRDYSVILPESWKEQDMTVIVFVSQYDYVSGNFEVLNAFEAPIGTVNPVEPALPSVLHLGAVAPQPVSAYGTLALDIEQTRSIEIALYSPLGQKVRELKSGTLTPGTHTIAVDATGLQAGTYFVVLTGDGIREVRPVVVVR